MRFRNRIESLSFLTDLHCRMSQTLRWEAGRIMCALACKRETLTRKYLSSAFTPVVRKYYTLSCLMLWCMPWCWPELFVYFQCFSWRSATKLANTFWTTYCPRGRMDLLKHCFCSGDLKLYLKITFNILCFFFSSVNLSQVVLRLGEINSSNGNWGRANTWLKRSV